MKKSIVSDYVREPELFRKLDTLAHQIFQISLTDWHRQGLLGANYIPYSCLMADTLAANVSANLYSCQIYGQTYKVVQLGTVMTDPAFRGQGLAAELMKHILSIYEKDSLFIFLFANASVLDFYPRFGFERAAQKRTLFDAEDLRKSNNKPGNFRPVFWENETDREVILSAARERVPNADCFGLTGDVSPRMIYLSDEDFSGKLFYSEDLHTGACLSIKERVLSVHDIFRSPHMQSVGLRADMDRILASLPLLNIDRVECAYTVDATYPNLTEELLDDSDALFVRASAPLIMPSGRRIMPFDPVLASRPEIDLSELHFSHLDHT